MAEDWRTACWNAEREVEGYKGTIVPALVEKVRELEEQLRGAKEHKQREWELFCASVLKEPHTYITLGGDHKEILVTM